MMKTILRWVLFVVLIVLILVTGARQARADRLKNTSSTTITAGNPSHYPWKSEYVQRQPNPVQDVGSYIAMTLRPFDDYPIVAYYDYTNGDLMLAISVGVSQGNCGTDNSWLCNPIDGLGGNVGSEVSIDAWGETINLWRLGISYRDIANNTLKVFILTCILGTCTPEYITPDCSSGTGEVGLNTSFKFKSNGYAAVAYYAKNYVYYAHQVDNGEKYNQSEPSIIWECEKIFQWFGQDNKSISLDFRYDNIPFISYHVYDLDWPGWFLGYAWKEPGYSCDADTTDWSCRNIDGSTNVGKYASIIAPHSPDEFVRAAYIVKTYGHLKYFQPGWSMLDVDDIGTSIDSMGVSMQLDKDGYPVIAYQKIESEWSPAALWIARPYMVYDDGEFGNCGEIPPGMFVQYWRCTPLDTGNQYVSEGNFLSLVVNSKGRVAIAYSEYDWYDYLMSAKFIYQFLYGNYLPITVK